MSITNGTIADQTELRKIYQTIPASYVVYKSGSTYYANSTTAGGTDYSGTDASTIIQNAIDAVTGGGRVFLKAGTYTLTTALSMKDRVSLYGEGLMTTILQTSGAISAIDSNGVHEWEINNLKISGTATATHGVYIRADSKYWHIYRVVITGFSNTGSAALRIDSGLIGGVTDCFLQYSDYGLYETKNAGYANSNFNTFRNVRFYNNVHYAAYLHNSYGNSFYHCLFENNERMGIELAGALIGTLIDTCWFEGQNSAAAANQYDIYLNDAHVNTIVNCYITSTTVTNTIYAGNSIANTFINNRVDNVAATFAGGAGSYLTLIGNYFELTPTVTAGTLKKAIGNFGFITENGGSATIANGTSSIAVTHGLIGTPTSIRVTGTTTDTDLLYVDTVGAVTFTIHASDGNVGADRTVYWQAEYTP